MSRFRQVGRSAGSPPPLRSRSGENETRIRVGEAGLVGRLVAEMSESREGGEMCPRHCGTVGSWGWSSRLFGKVWKEVLARYVDFLIPFRREWWKM